MEGRQHKSELAVTRSDSIHAFFEAKQSAPEKYL